MTKLKLKRLQKGLSVGKLVVLSGVTKKTILKLEKESIDKSKTYDLTWFKLAQALGCSMEEIKE